MALPNYNVTPPKTLLDYFDPQKQVEAQRQNILDTNKIREAIQQREATRAALQSFQQVIAGGTTGMEQAPPEGFAQTKQLAPGVTSNVPSFEPRKVAEPFYGKQGLDVNKLMQSPEWRAYSQQYPEEATAIMKEMGAFKQRVGEASIEKDVFRDGKWIKQTKDETGKLISEKEYLPKDKTERKFLDMRNDEKYKGVPDSTLFTMAENEMDKKEAEKESRKQAAEENKEQRKMPDYDWLEKNNPKKAKEIDTLVEQVYKGNMAPSAAMTQLKTMGRNYQTAFTQRYVDKHGEYDQVKMEAQSKWIQNTQTQRYLRNITNVFGKEGAVVQAIKVAAEVGNKDIKMSNLLKQKYGEQTSNAMRIKLQTAVKLSTEELAQIFGGAQSSGSVAYQKLAEKMLDPNISAGAFIENAKMLLDLVKGRASEMAAGTYFADTINDKYAELQNIIGEAQSKASGKSTKLSAEETKKRADNY